MMDLHLGDCLDVLRTLPDCSVDSIVTDPPYGLSDHKPAEVLACLSAWIKGEPYLPKGRGFMGQEWDAWVPGPEVWREVLRVLKPGGHAMVFAGTRSMDIMSMALRLAGFELRDSIGYAHDGGGAPVMAWTYGTGFPKSLDVSKGIDKAGGLSPREQSELLRAKRESIGMTRAALADAIGCTVSSVRDWEEGRAREIGSPVEYLVPSDVYRSKLADILGYSADERRVIGAVNDRRDDGSVYGIGHSGELRSGGHTDAARQWGGWGTALKPAWEPIILARKPLMGTVVENVLKHGTGAININGCRIGATDAGSGAGCDWDDDVGRWPANLIHDGSPQVVDAFPQSNGSGSARTLNRGQRNDGDGWGMADAPGQLRDAGTGSAARFFFCPKASKADRDEGLEAMPLVTADPYGQHRGRRMDGNDTRIDGKPPAVGRNDHPTVKPTDLMAYLCRLVTPPGGTVLDPFMGSGSTGKGAIREGFNFIGVERDAHFMRIARARIEFEVAKVLAGISRKGVVVSQSEVQARRAQTELFV